MDTGRYTARKTFFQATGGVTKRFFPGDLSRAAVIISMLATGATGAMFFTEVPAGSDWNVPTIWIPNPGTIVVSWKDHGSLVHEAFWVGNEFNDADFTVIELVETVPQC